LKYALRKRVEKRGHFRLWQVISVQSNDDLLALGLWEFLSQLAIQGGIDASIQAISKAPDELELNRTSPGALLNQSAQRLHPL
jgi:hypothetical protein